MARGWESKSVEQQQEEMTDRGKSSPPPLSATEQRINRRRQGLELARKRLTEQLRSVVRLERRQMLERSLAEIDKQLSSFDKFSAPSPRK
jgi:uncharacterized protein involved in exopolysaccharide biosynthesis